MAPRWLRKCCGLDNLDKQSEPPAAAPRTRRFRKCFGLGERSEPPAVVATAVAQSNVDAEMAQMDAFIEPWDDEIEEVRHLQPARMNQGSVVLVSGLTPGAFAAVKRMPNDWVCRGPADFERRRPESPEKPWFDIAILRVLEQMQFPYVCRLLGVFRTEEETMVATEYCPQGDVFEWVFHHALREPGPRREEQLRPLTAQIVDAVRWLHDFGVAHRDISMENILVTRSSGDLQIKLIDYGMATLRRRVSGEMRGKDSYKAPELHRQRTVDTYLVDAFVVGVVRFSMTAQDYPRGWTGGKPKACRLFREAEEFGVRNYVNFRPHRKTFAVLGELYSAELLDVIASLLQLDPKARASFGEAAFEAEVRRGMRSSTIDKPYFKKTGCFRPRRNKGLSQCNSSSTVGSGRTSSTAASTLSSCLLGR